MRALRFHSARDLRLEELADPAAPGPRQVSVEPLWCGICGTDLHEYVDGPIYCPREPHPLTGAELPQILGHEFSARVTAVGSAVTGISPGDRIAAMPIVRCGSCRACWRGEFELCENYACIGLNTEPGGFATAAVIDDYQALRLPDSVSDRDGALIEPVAVAATALERGGVGNGSRVFISGAGPIGALVALLCQQAGAAQVILSEPGPTRRRWIADAGLADAVVDPLAGDVEEAVVDLTAGNRADVAIECSGAAPAFADCVAALRNGGTLVQVGLFGGSASVEPFGWCSKNLSIQAMVNHPLNVWLQVIDLVSSGKIDLGQIVTSTADLETAVDAFDRLLEPDGPEVKVLVRATSDALG